jgi:AcrR family transcriptional regulator
MARLNSQRRSGRDASQRPRESSAPPRTARGQATQAALIRAARRIFERDGFLEARITDITATAGTATGSFYSYFSSKEELFTAVIDQLNEKEGLHPPSMAFLPDDLDDLVGSVARHHREYLENYARNAKLMSVMEQVTTISDEFRRHRTRRAQIYMMANAEAIRQLQAAGMADPSLDPIQTARSLSTMVSRSAFVSFVLEEETADKIDLLVNTLTRIWINALRLPVPSEALAVLTK